MILHLISDDKFADYAIEQFASIDPSSVFLLVKSSDKEPIRNIKNTNKVRQVSEHSPEFEDILKNISTDTSIVTHGLFYPWQERIINFVPQGVKIAWVFWGGEIYGRPDLRKSFLSTKSRWLLFLKEMKNRLKIGNTSAPYFVDQSIYQRLDYCLTDVYEDYRFVCQYANASMKELWYNYYSNEDTVGESLMDKKINGGNILIGNSSTIENNHLDAMRLLKKFDLKGRKLIVPLSYGEKWLRRLLLSKGKRMFRASFCPLCEFVDRYQYNEYLLSCSIVVMNHYRPQAMGNLITSLWLGSKVYMSKKSILFQYFKRIGLVVFSIEEDLTPRNGKALQNLEEFFVDENRRILWDVYGKENVLAKVEAVVKELNPTK